MLLHASCAALGSDAVLFLGPSGSGKSDLVLRLLRQGWRLVADDQVAVTPRDGQLLAAAPDPLFGMLEVRGVGIFAELPVAPRALLRLAVRLAPPAEVPRLPMPDAFEAEGIRLPAVTLHAFDVSAPAKVEAALQAATGAWRQHAGAFAA